MAKIKVHLFNFFDIYSHMEIALENISEKPTKFYKIDRCSKPGDSWFIYYYSNYLLHLERTNLGKPRWTYCFEIEADPDQIVQDWKNYYERTVKNTSIFGENCAIAAQKFLTHFANIPEPSTSYISWNHFFFGIMWPSFIPCPLTLPGRVMSNAKFHTKKRVVSIDDLSSECGNEYREKTISILKGIQRAYPKKQKTALARFNTLTEFYDALDRVSTKATDLYQRGFHKEADCAKKLSDKLAKNAQDFIESDGTDNSINTFKSRCKQDINVTKSMLEKHRGWKQILGNLALAVAGVGVFYLLAASVNKVKTGHFLFFKTNAMKKVDQVTIGISLACERALAINKTSLTLRGR